MKQLFAELKRRNVTRVAVTYIAAAWLLIEVADTTFPRFGLGDSAVRNVIILLAIGVVPAVVLAWFFELTPEGVKRDSEADRAAAYTRQPGKATDRLIVVMLLAAVGLFAVDKFVLDPARDATRIDEAAEAARTDAILGSYGDKSIAVLAFSDMSPAGDQEYLSDGIAEELLNMLSTIKELRVISRSTAFTFKGSNATIPEIAEKLDVAYILEGSVRKSGNNIRITAQLIDAKADAHIWSDNYDRTLDDIFAVQDEISDTIVEKLRLTLLNGNPRSREIDPRAYELYLQAQYIVHTDNASQFREAQALLNEALAIAPDYIPALNALGRLYIRLPPAEGVTSEQHEAEIKAVADRVAAIEPGGISALIWQGWFAFQDGDYQTAADHYERAIEIDPNNTNLLRVLVPFLTKIGRSDEALDLGFYLLRRDPACAACVANVAGILRATGRPEDEITLRNSILNWRAPGRGFYWNIGVGQLVAGRPQEALDNFEKESMDGNREMGTIMALHDLGRSEEFEARFAGYRNDSASAEGVARIYAWIGDNDKAFEWLNRMVEKEGPSSLGRVNTDLYAKIKPDPRWDRLRSKHGFEDGPDEIIDFTYTLPAGAQVDSDAQSKGTD